MQLFWDRAFSIWSCLRLFKGTHHSSVTCVVKEHAPLTSCRLWSSYQDMTSLVSFEILGRCAPSVRISKLQVKQWRSLAPSSQWEILVVARQRLFWRTIPITTNEEGKKPLSRKSLLLLWVYFVYFEFWWQERRMNSLVFGDVPVWI